MLLRTWCWWTVYADVLIYFPSLQLSGKLIIYQGKISEFHDQFPVWDPDWGWLRLTEAECVGPWLRLMQWILSSGVCWCEACPPWGGGGGVDVCPVSSNASRMDRYITDLPITALLCWRRFSANLWLPRPGNNEITQDAAVSAATITTTCRGDTIRGYFHVVLPTCSRFICSCDLSLEGATAPPLA